MTPYFSLSIGWPEVALLAAEVASGAVLQLATRRALRGRAKLYGATLDANPENESGASQTEEHWPALAVVAFASCNTDELNDLAAALSAQKYPGSYSVVIVYDASAEAMKGLADRFAELHPGVHLTFIPPGSHNLSRVKLANTIGIKAAANADVILTTTSASRPQSDVWAREMARPFLQPDTQIVLGTTTLPFASMGIAGRYREFDFVLSSAQWIRAAAKGKAYRGVGENLAFRRHFFFDKKGYAASIDLHRGEDDIFVSQVATADNCAVVDTPEARMLTDYGASNSRKWLDLKEERRFTAHYLSRRPAKPFAWGSAAAWLQLLCAAGAVAISWPNLTIALAALVVLLAFWSLTISDYRVSARSAHARPLLLGVVPFLLWRPIGSALFGLRTRAHRVRNFTWQAPGK